MKLTILSSIALYTSLTTAATSLNVPSVLSDFYSRAPTGIPAAASTSLASALYSVQSTWSDSPAYTSALNAIYSAAPSSAKSSIEASGYIYDDVLSQAWYTKSVPTAVQTAVKNQLSALDSAAAKIVGTPSSSTNAAPMRTAAPVVMGAVGIMLGALL